MLFRLIAAFIVAMAFAAAPVRADNFPFSQTNRIPPSWFMPGAAASNLSVISPRVYGASGSIALTTGSIAAGSNVLTLASPIDFANPTSGQTVGVLVLGAGAAGASAAGQPTSIAVTPTNKIGGTATGSTTYSYKLASCGGYTDYGVATAAATIANGASSLNAMTYNLLTWTNGSGATGVCIWRSTNGGAYSWVARVIGTSFVDSFPAAYLYAPSFSYPSTPPSTGRAQALATSIVSGAGSTTLTLSSPATTAVSGATVTHEDTAAINAALAQLPNTGYLGGYVRLEPGSYLISGLTAAGSGRFGGDTSSGVNLVPWTDATVFTTTTANDFLFQGVAIAPWDLFTKAGGWCWDMKGQYHAYAVDIQCAGYNGFNQDTATVFNGQHIRFNAMLGTEGFWLHGSSGAPAAMLVDVGSTTVNVPNTWIIWIDHDSYEAGVTVFGESNFSGGGVCYATNDRLNTGSSYPKYGFVRAGCDHVNGDGVQLNAGISVQLAPTSYISSSQTGRGVNIPSGSAFKGGLTIAPDATITGNCLQGVDVETDTGAVGKNLIAGQITANGSCSGYDEIKLGAGVGHVEFAFPHISNANAAVSTSDGYCINAVAGSGDGIQGVVDVSGSCTSGALSMNATGAHNSIIDQSSGGISLGTRAPGNNVAVPLLSGSAASASWPFSLAQIYDASGIDDYLLFGGALGSTATRGSPTLTGAFANMAMRYNYAAGRLDILYAAAGTNVAPTTLLSITNAGVLSVNGSVGVSCAGSPSSSFATNSSGIVTHC